MNYPEKTIAQQLYKNLNIAFEKRNGLFSKFFRPKNADIVISIGGGGVHWNCKVEKDIRKCTIACFHYETTYKKGPEYYIEFIESGIDIATGRTSDSNLVLTAIKDWINEKTISQLYEIYQFVDEFKRKLEFINATILASDVMFQDCKSSLEQSWGDSFDYTLQKKEKAIQYYIDGYSVPPKNGFGFKFLWDETTMFYAYSEELNDFNPLVFDWLIKDLKPSELKTRYPWIKVYSVATYYEQGHPITGEFVESWDKVEIFYARNDYGLQDKILAFIKTMRDKGFDKTLRAGTSLYSLILSKSRRHGLRLDQPRIIFSFNEKGVHIYSGNQHELLSEEIQLTDKIEKLLVSLNAKPID